MARSVVRYDLDDETRKERDRKFVLLAHIQHQFDSLAVAIESGRASIPQTPAQWMRCLQEIGRGGEWERGTWR